MTSQTNDPKIRGTVEIIQLDKPVSADAIHSPGSITSTVSITHGPPPPSIFDDANDEDNTKNETLMTKPLDRTPHSSPPLSTSTPARSFTNTGENVGNQLAANPHSSVNSDTGGTSTGNAAKNTCGATCAILLSAGGLGMVALLGVLAVVGYKRRSRGQLDDMENNVHHPQQRATLKAPPRRKPKLYVIGPGGLRESVATEEDRERARAAAMEQLVGADGSTSKKM